MTLAKENVLSLQLESDIWNVMNYIRDCVES